MVKSMASRSTSKFLAMALGAIALSLWTTGKARADDGAAAAGTPDDGQVVQRALQLEVAEEQLSHAVKPRLGSPEAWTLADRIGSDYAALDRELTALAGTVPGSGGDAMGDAADLGELSNLSGDALDKAYVDREVKAHEAMLAAIDNQLLPAAKSDEARRSLLDLRAEATVHLAAARNIHHAEQVRDLEAQERALISRENDDSVP